MPPTAVLVISDGTNEGGRVSPAAAARRARARHVPVSTVVVGTPGGVVRRTVQGGFVETVHVPPSPDTLRAISETTGGRFFSVRTDDGLREVYERLGSRLGRTTSREVTDVFAAASAMLARRRRRAVGAVAPEAPVTFGHPLLLLTLLAPALAALGYLLVDRRPARYPVRFTNLDVLADVVTTRPSWRSRVAPALFVAALAGLCVAVARPHAATTVLDERATVALAIDASRSMESDDVKPTRLAAAERAAKRFLDQIPKRLRVALVVFSGDVQVAAPPTTDRVLVRDAIDGIGSFSGFGGTAIGDAIARSVEVGRGRDRGRAARSRDRRVPVGRPPEPRRHPAARRGRACQASRYPGEHDRPGHAERRQRRRTGRRTALGRLRRLRLRGNRSPDPATLRRIARITGGQFFAARSAASLDDAYTRLGTKVARRPARTEVTFAFVLGSAFLLLGSTLAAVRWAPRIP